MTSFLPFHGFSPVVKSLRVDFATLPLSQIFNLILSFPLLNDLSVIASEASADNEDSSNGLSTIVEPSNPSVFAGSPRNIRRGEAYRPSIVVTTGGLPGNGLTREMFY